MLARLNQEFPWYAPGRFLKSEHQAALAMEPRPLTSVALALAGEAGAPVDVELSAVLVPVSRSRASIMIVDNRARVVYGQRYVEGPEHVEFANRLTADVMAAIRSVYQKDAEAARSERQAAPNGCG